MILKQKEIFNDIIDERFEKIADLDKKDNSDDLIYRYKGRTAVEKFDKFDNATSITKIQNGEISLADIKKQIKRNLNQI